MGAGPIAVVTADFIDSRHYGTAARRRLATALQQAYREARTAVPAGPVTGLGLRIAAGDEFQFVLQDVPNALSFVLYLRSVLAAVPLDPVPRFRAAIGVGRATIAPARGPKASSYQWDGPAFVLAREGIDALGGRRGFLRWTSIRTATPDVDRTLEVVTGFQDHLQQAWTIPQWEAIRWALRGLTRTAIAARVKVAHQNVTKRLAAAGWPVFEDSVAFVQETLTLHLKTGARR